MDDLRAGRRPVGVAGEDDVAAAGQQCGKALEGLAAHHHRLAHGHRLEALEVGRKVPDELAAAADHAVVGAGEHQDDLTLRHSPPPGDRRNIRPSYPYLLWSRRSRRSRDQQTRFRHPAWLPWTGSELAFRVQRADETGPAGFELDAEPPLAPDVHRGEDVDRGKGGTTIDPVGRAVGAVTADGQVPRRSPIAATAGAGRRRCPPRSSTRTA